MHLPVGKRVSVGIMKTGGWSKVPLQTRVTGLIGSSQRGMTLLELSIAMAVMGLVGAGLSVASFQVTRVPVAVEANLRSTQTLRSNSQAMSDDVHFSQVFSPRKGANFATFEAIDFTNPVPKVESASYSYSLETATVQRESSVGGVTQGGITVANDVPQEPLLTRSLVTGTIATSVNQATTVLGAEQRKDNDLLLVMEVPGPSIHPPDAGPPPMDPKAFCLGGSLNLAGKEQPIVGDGVIGGRVAIAGSRNAVTGAVLANGGMVVSGAQHTLPAVGTAGDSACRMKLLPSMFGAFAFQFPSDTDLKSVPAVWEDSRRKVLKSGVYFVDGTLTLDGSEISGQVTLIARAIVIKGSRITLTPNLHGVVLLALGTAAPLTSIQLDGNNLGLRGVVYADTGDVGLNGSTNALDGAIVAPRGGLTVSGANVRISLSPSLFRAADGVSLKE